ncbi:ABC transporter permease subunit [Bacillus glycinifermentans]|uniref:ABC transporter permease subunit n=1 Tax=Bacillus glycinifermentans TaxID=1664069 RepID=UPI001FF56D32|nr:ABC transporter permease subunit [Bacillus glycinifermentans]MEC3607688.1 ABC transporter permease subunit [Bacillus glycinifermentans]UOY86740.1 ABC transporter permease [Bacillus glycinifermentans]
MRAICLNEFKSLFKSIKSIIVIAIIFFVSFKVADVIENLPADMVGELDLGSDANAAGTAMIVFLLGFLIITGLSHDIINREVYTRTIRFLVTKTSRPKIIIGKFLGVWLFWFTCILASYILVMIVSKTFLWQSAADSMAFLTAAIALNLLFSVIFPKPAMSMFFGIVFALFFPALSIWAIFSDNMMISWFKYLSPYYYSNLGHYFTLINIVYAIAVLGGAIALFKRRDL